MRKKPVPTIPSEPATIHSLTHEGVGIASVQGKVTFIEGALPQETVKYRLFKERRHYNEGATLEIITPSAERSTARCPHFGRCGGCSMQHLDASAQLVWKQKILLEQLERLGQVVPDEILAPLSASAWGYRHKARLGARYAKIEQKVLVGFRQKFANHLADLSICEVLHPSIGHSLPELNRLINNLDAKEQIPQIEVAIGDQQSALIFRHLIALTAHDLQQFREFGQKHQLHIYLQPTPPEAVSLLWPENTEQRLSYRLPEFDIELLFHPMDFTQIHLELNQLMVKQALQLLDPQPNENILDLFCGIGNFSLPLARFARKVVGIEGSQIMVERAYENAVHNKLNNLEFYAANLFEPPLQASWLHQSYEKILLDPPRSGAQEIIPHLARISPERIVYVSCNPATMARDANLLVQNQGYRLKKAGIMNMFPHTNHIEAMAVFEKG